MAYLSGIHDLEVLNQGGQTVLQSASGALGGITSFRIDPGGPAQFLSQAAYATTTLSYSPVPYGGTTIMLSLVRLNKMLALVDAGPAGSSSSTPIHIRNNGFAGDKVTMLAVDLNGVTHVYAGVNGDAGIARYRLSGASTLVAQGTVTDGPDRHLGDVSAMASARTSVGAFLFAASAGENGISSFRIAADGSLTLVDDLGPKQQLYIATPGALETARVGGETFLLATAAGSGTLSAIRVFPDGKMKVVDTVFDTLDTRFAGANVLETVTAGDRVFVLVAGSDDGISLLTLLPGGRLMHLGSLADSAGTVLNNVTALSAAVVGSEIQVFVSSQNEPGISQFRIDLTALGLTQIGSAGADVMAGGARDDVLAGRDGDDRLDGGSGDDILMDGAGVDQMTGGAGADTFLLTYDGQTDRIMDFQPGIDRLDLTAWPLFHTVGQMALTSTADGAILRFGNETLELVSAARLPLGLGHFSNADIFNLARQIGLLDGPGVTLSGTSRSDIMIGASGNDLFKGSGAGDWMVGGSGYDKLTYGTKTLPLVLDLKRAYMNQGQASGDEYDSIEWFCATDSNDTMWGDGYGNRMCGGLGEDWMMGRGGSDRLEGEGGRDIIQGGVAADILTGGAMRDQFIYSRPTDSLAQAKGWDIITDFEDGLDMIILRGIDANAGLAGDQAFVMAASGSFTGRVGEVRVFKDAANNRTFIQADLDGNRQADMQIELTGLFDLTAADFQL